MKNNILIFGIIFVVLSSLTFTILNYEKNSKIEKYLENKAKQYVQSYNATYEGYKKLANVIYETDINTKEVRNIFKSASETTGAAKDLVRVKLYNYLKNTYELLKKYNIKQLHFHLPNNESFLRFHRPKKFGDNLTDIRATIKYVNETKKPIDGFEEGRIYNGYRFVFPLSCEGKHIGSVEVSFSTIALSLEIINSYNVIAPFLISKDVIKEKVFNDEQSNYIKSEFEKFYLEKELVQIISKTAKTKTVRTLSQKTKDIINKRGLDNNSFSIYEPKRQEIMTFIKVKNPVSHKVVGILVVQSSADYIFNKTTNFFVILIFSIVLIALVLLLIYKELEQKAKFQIQAQKEYEINVQLQKANIEIEKNRLDQEKLFKYEKMASMGEMIGNIAHQWRQPLSVISTAASGIKINYEFGMLKEENIPEYMDTIVKNTEFLSDTIDTFRDFIGEEKELKEIVLQKRIEDILKIISASLENNNIKIKTNTDNIEPIKLAITAGELDQVIINIINNAKDILVERKVNDAWIKLDLVKEKNKILITIEDNGGGIDKEALPKIFDPYFTTKHKSQGTGLGLHISYKIVTKSLMGKLYVQNTEAGVKFFIELPMS